MNGSALKSNLNKILNFLESRIDKMCKIIEDKQHNIWGATEHGLIKIYKNLGYKLFNKENGLAGVDIPSVLCDYEGEIWVSCFGNGIYKLI